MKKQALYYLDKGADIERWEIEHPKEAKIRKKVLSELEKKLLSPQPSEKKITQYKLYHCQWKTGDIFAYQFLGEYAMERGFGGKYVYFVKVAEAIWHPGHTVPIVYFF